MLDFTALTIILLSIDLKYYLYKVFSKKCELRILYLVKPTFKNKITDKWLHAIFVSERDRVPVIKVASDNALEHALTYGFFSKINKYLFVGLCGFLPSFAPATDQGGKLGLSKNKIASVTDSLSA
ncbi:unnamed protein product [Nyctereutes procyonoides]|uniref:(raccoon dog) hypothetical protein n=1 Tax=Nyctereutes procyonoides TaxID=34880 RepID=A0A811Y7G7_NYCPR|nr:unnamed protein product [Nyctereutes procyonoides]